MRAVVQRVNSASVRIGGKVVAKCSRGFVVLLAAHRNDTEREADRFAEKIASLRIFSDAEGKMNLAIGDLPPQENGQVLAISNFTIYGDTSKSRRPSFIESAPYDEGERLFSRAVEAMRRLGLVVETGEFGAHMEVELVNDGPVTVIVDVPPRP